MHFLAYLASCIFSPSAQNSHDIAAAWPCILKYENPGNYGSVICTDMYIYIYIYVLVYGLMYVFIYVFTNISLIVPVYMIYMYVLYIYIYIYIICVCKVRRVFLSSTVGCQKKGYRRMEAFSTPS